MRPTDRLGHPLTAPSRDVVERYDVALDALLRFSTQTMEAWDATVEEAPGFALGQIGRAYLRCLSSEASGAAEARGILSALGDGSELTDRERRHLAAARAYAGGDLQGAAERLVSLSTDYPLDALALFVGHQLDFFCGDATGLRERIARALSSWTPSDPHYGFVLGMHAFGLEECNLYPQAEAAALEALAHEPRDVWAHHAAVHVHEMLGRVRPGLRFLEERRAEWVGDNLFLVHNHWHEALFLLELGDTAGALRIYDSVLHSAGAPGIALELLDAAALLWRLELDRVDVGGRWASLADAWMALRGEPWYAFNDMHAVMSFVGAGRLIEARSVVHRLDAFVRSQPPGTLTNARMTAEIGLPVCAAILAFGEARYADVVEILHPIRKSVHRFGGSHAQRDAVARTLLEAALRSGQLAIARALLSERLALRDSSVYAWQQLARLRRAATDERGAEDAERRAVRLRRGMKGDGASPDVSPS